MSPKGAVPATPADTANVIALLTRAELPTADLTAARMTDFLVVRDGRGLVGAVALETHGAAGLLRSLAVSPAARGTGLGKELVAALEAHARRRGLAELWLLTTTAAPFFAKLGYRTTDRAGAPEAVRGSSEFTALCPSSAVCMTKAL